MWNIIIRVFIYLQLFELAKLAGLEQSPLLLGVDIFFAYIFMVYLYPIYPYPPKQ